MKEMRKMIPGRGTGPINRLSSGGEGLHAGCIDGQGWVYFWVRMLKGLSRGNDAEPPSTQSISPCTQVLLSGLSRTPWYRCNRLDPCGTHLNRDLQLLPYFFPA